MVVFVRNTVCRLSPAKFGATTATLIDKLLAAGARIGVSPPKVDPLGDYTLRLFRLMDRTRPGSAAALRACRRRRYTARCAAPKVGRHRRGCDSGWARGRQYRLLLWPRPVRPAAPERHAGSVSSRAACWSGVWAGCAERRSAGSRSVGADLLIAGRPEDDGQPWIPGCDITKQLTHGASARATPGKDRGSIVSWRHLLVAATIAKAALEFLATARDGRAGWR